MDVAELAPDTTLAAARLLVLIFTVYAALGVLVGIAFVARGAERLDHGARGGSLGFKLLIFPASAALWPLLLLRWRRANGEAPVERSGHRDRAAAPSEAAR